MLKTIRLKIATNKYSIHEYIELFETFLQHPNFQILETGSHVYDYALLKLAKPVQLSSTVGIVCLPFDNSNMFVGNMLVASGWGLFSYEGKSGPEVLYAVALTGISHSDCAMMQGIALRKEIHLCASEPSHDGGVCKGDSGGNLLVLVLSIKTMCLI